MKSLFRFLISTLAASTLFVSRVGAQVVDYGSANGIYSFEKDAQPALASKGSAVSISDEHAKLGRHALKWEWKKKGSALTMEADVPYLPENPDPKETSVSSFVFWVYAPESIQGSLRFAFLKDGKECCHFTYKLGKLTVKAFFKSIKSVLGIAFVDISADALEIVEITAFVLCVLYHFPLHQIVWHNVSVCVIRCTVDVTRFSRIGNVYCT